MLPSPGKSSSHCFGPCSIAVATSSTHTSAVSPTSAAIPQTLAVASLPLQPVRAPTLQNRPPTRHPINHYHSPQPPCLHPLLLHESTLRLPPTRRFRSHVRQPPSQPRKPHAVVFLVRQEEQGVKRAAKRSDFGNPIARLRLLCISWAFPPSVPTTNTHVQHALSVQVPH